MNQDIYFTLFLVLIGTACLVAVLLMNFTHRRRIKNYDEKSHADKSGENEGE